MVLCQANSYLNLTQLTPEIFATISDMSSSRLVNLYLPNLYIYRHSKCCPQLKQDSKLLYEKGLSTRSMLRSKTV